MKYVGGLMRPGANLAMSEAELTALPGFSRDIVSARAEAKRLLAEAGVENLSLTVLVRDIPMPHYAGADLLAESWKELGITVAQDRRNIWDWQKVVDAREFDIALDFSGARELLAAETKRASRFNWALGDLSSWHRRESA